VAISHADFHRNSRNKKRGRSKSARWRRRASASHRALHRAMHRLNENAEGRVCECTRIRTCVCMTLRVAVAVQRAANDFSLRSRRAKCIIYLRSRQARLGVRERRPSCDVRIHTEGILFAEAVPGKENPRTMRESPFLLSAPRSRSFFIPGGRCATNALIAPARCLRRNDECADDSIN